MLVPNTNTLWRYVGPGNAHGDIQRVVSADDVEVVTISERARPEQIDWSYLGPTSEFPKMFKFYEAQHSA